MRFDRLLAGSAIALVLTASMSAQAGDSQISVEVGLTGTLAVEGGRAITQPTLATTASEERSAPTTTTTSSESIESQVPMIEPAEVVITAADIAPATTTEQPKAETTPPTDSTTASIRLTNIPGARVEANADPDATSAITPVAPATALTPASPVAAPEPSAPAAATPPETTTPAAPMPPEITLSPFGEKLRSLMAESQSARMFSRETLSSLSSFYAARSYEPLWTDKGVMTDRAKAALAQLKSADDDGLDPADYAVPALESNASVDALAEFELKFTNAVIDYARHAAVGREHWSHVARDIVYQTEPPAAADLLTKLSTASDVRAALDSYNPQHKFYKALKAKLAELRGKKDKVEEPISIGSGPMLRLGMEDERVPDLRKLLKVEGPADSKAYDEAVEEAVKAFQKDHGLSADGLLGPGTLSALNGKKTTEQGNVHTIDVILANMERWRWIPHDLGEAYVIVNIPEFMLRLYDHGSLLWQTRIVVGMPSKPTPLLTETMKFITVNPTWNVPPSIVYGEYMPALQQDPTVLARMGLRVSYTRNGVHISQPPGPGNALGRIRFNFPNKFLVYQHDTPDKYMFKHVRRAYSHGCMRVQDPDVYAEKLLSIALPDKHYTAAQIRGMYGHGEVNIDFPKPIPVNLTYQTAYVDPSGKLKLFDDVYGRDSRTVAGLKSDGEKIAMPAQEPARRRVRRQVYREPVRQGGFNFFGLFR
jgi:murein L,D-transpeptidase YcbB/YkuD